ncbi:unnamed protein product [Moneuplotes crassus]|uniref:FCP1 homology domain-containing protein n=3 Tax=Euplotes crassus TaxID=5936 RepID=A0AAD1XT47_EUPCR|nr:unnamed protein product [Moneuplotes crassus]
MENSSNYRRKRRLINKNISEGQECLDSDTNGLQIMKSVSMEDKIYSQTAMQNRKGKARGTMNAKIVRGCRENQRYDASPFDDDFDQQVSHFRFSVNAGPEEGIDCLRESNPFFDFNSGPGHKVVDKLFKNTQDHRQRFTNINPAQSVFEKRESIKRSGSMARIGHQMTNATKIIELANNALKCSQVKKNKECIINRPPKMKASLTQESQSADTFTLKDENMVKMQNLIYGDRKRQSNADQNIMDIFNKSMNRKNSVPVKETSFNNCSKYARRAMNIDEALDEIEKHRKSFAPNMSTSKVRKNTTCGGRYQNSRYQQDQDSLEDTKTIEELEHKPGGAPLEDEDDTSPILSEDLIQDLEFEANKEKLAETTNEERVSVYKVRESNRRKRHRKNHEEKENDYSGKTTKTEDPSDLAPENVQKEKESSLNNEKIRTSLCKTTGKLKDHILDQSIDSVGEAADVTMTMEDYPLTHTMEILSSKEVFKPKGMKKVDLEDKNEVAYSKDLIKNQRFGKLNKHADVISYEDHEAFPDYPGFYFREIYRNTAIELLEQGENLDVELTDYVRNCDEESVIPELSDKIVDDNKTHATQSMQGLYYVNTIQPTDAYISQKVTLPPTDKKKLAIFDMDETLIHCVFDRGVVSNTNEGPKKTDAMLKFKCTSEGIEYLPVNVRPFIRECILEIKKYYQVIVFTASKKEYADTILNYIDPDGDLIEARCYRDSCYTTQDYVYIKDLRIFEDQWDMKDIVLIDNAVHSFGFQINNGIPMLPFYDDKKDTEMIYLAHYLNDLQRQADMRPMIERTFWIKKLTNDQILEAIEGVIEYAIEEVIENVEDDFEFSDVQPKSFDLDENPLRQSITDLEFTDDIDEREGEVDTIPNIAMCARTIPCKPSSAKIRLNKTVCDIKSTTAAQPFQSKKCKVGGNYLSKTTNLDGDNSGDRVSKSKKFDYQANINRGKIFNYKQTNQCSIEDIDDDAWIKKNMDEIQDTLRRKGKPPKIDSVCI